VTPGNFNEVKYLMRPVTLSSAPAMDEVLAGGYILKQTGMNLQVFRTDGTQISLPDTLHQSDLPLSMLVNATGLGTSTLIALYDPSLGSLVRAGQRSSRSPVTRSTYAWDSSRAWRAKASRCTPASSSCAPSTIRRR
jgi:hypothetical protein